MKCMNVKKTSSTKLTKDRSLKDLSSKKNIPHTVQKAKIGEQIRKKLKVNNNVNTGVSKYDKENISNNAKTSSAAKKVSSDKKKSSFNFFKNSQSKAQRVDQSKTQKELLVKKEERDQPKTERTTLGHKFLDPKKGQYHRSSSKSVRFSDRFQQSTLSRKGSSSSILKNSSIIKKSNLSEKGSLNNSICSNIVKEDQSCENMTINKALKEKFQKTFTNLQKQQKKYCDQLYPPVWSSICRICSSDIEGITWKRISDIFPGKYLTLWDTDSKISIGPGRHSKSKVQANCFNTIKHNHFLMEKLFQSQKYNSNGIYYIKINQNNSWKYVIVDDYVPVCVGKDGKSYESAYLTMNSSSATKVQIWPLLLQKAYAKYYSTYQSLENNNEIDFLQEITGCPIEKLEVSSENMKKIHEEIKNFDSILFAKHQNQRSYPIVPRKSQITLENPLDNYSEFSVKQDSQFIRDFQEIYCIFLHKYFYTGFCSIRFNCKGSESEDQHISVRSLKIQEYTDCVISICQKDMKHYTHSYKYIWARIMVIMKESSKNYRWIDGAYSNSKNIHVRLNLEPGQYFIFFIPEWQKAKNGFDYNVVFHGNTKCLFERKPYKGNQFMITEAAMDLAQTNGVLKQLNQNICTYSYIERKLGLIIENINNQRHNGHVKILRSIEGLQRGGKKLIRAFNKEFRKEATIQVKIESLDHFTVVLGVIGGVNKGFLDQFDFGS